MTLSPGKSPRRSGHILIEELPTNTIPPGRGLLTRSLSSKARISDSNRSAGAVTTTAGGVTAARTHAVAPSAMPTASARRRMLTAGRCASTAQFIGDLGTLAVNGPVQRRAFEDCVLDVSARATFEQQLDDIVSTRRNRVVQRRCVRVKTFGTESIGIFSRIEKDSHDVSMAVLRSQCERDLLASLVRSRQQPRGFFDATQARRGGQSVCRRTASR